MLNQSESLDIAQVAFHSTWTITLALKAQNGNKLDLIRLLNLTLPSPSVFYQIYQVLSVVRRTYRVIILRKELKQIGHQLTSD